MKTSWIKLLLLAALMCGALPPAAHAAIVNWGNGSQGLWNSGLLWMGGSAPVAADTANFSGVGVHAIDVNGASPFTIDQITIGGGPGDSYSFIDNSNFGPPAGWNLVTVTTSITKNGLSRATFHAMSITTPLLTVNAGDLVIAYTNLFRATTVNITGGTVCAGTPSPASGSVSASTAVCGASAGNWNVSGGTLNINGTLGGNVCLTGTGSSVSAGCSVGTAMVDALTFNPGSVATFELGLPGPGTSDEFYVNGALTLNGKVNIVALSGFGPMVYTLFYYGSLSGIPEIGTAPSGYDYVFDLTMLDRVKLIVTLDTTPPTLVSAAADCASNKVILTFSECLDSTTAGDGFNYAISGGVIIQNVIFPGLQTTLLNENFNTGNGGFTVSTPLAYAGQWAYDAGSGSWKELGQDPDNAQANTSFLTSPAVTVPGCGDLHLTFAHRHSFESGGWDGGQVRMSVNSGPFTAVPAAAFSQNGYGGLVVASSSSQLAGQPAFVEESTGHAAGTFITSVARLGSFNLGDFVRVQFMAASDSNTRGAVPNWQLDRASIAFADGKTVLLCTDPFTPLTPGVIYTLGVGGVKDVVGNTINPDPSQIEFSCPPVIIDQPDSQMVAIGGSVTLEVAATGNGPLSYQWRRFHPGATNLAGETNDTFTITNFQLPDVDDYDVVVSSPSGGSTKSAQAHLAAAAAPPCIPPPPGLVAWWPLDELAGATTYAEVVNNITTIIMSGPLCPGPLGPPYSTLGPQAVAGYVAGASYFPRFNTYGHANNSPWLNFGPPGPPTTANLDGSFSLDCWALLPGGPAGSPFHTIVDKLDAAPTGYAVGLDASGNVELRVADGALYTATSIASVVPFVWNFVAVSVDRSLTPNEVTFHVNGVTEPAQLMSPLFIGSTVNVRDLYIGSDTVPGAVSEIALDEVELFNRPLTSIEMNDLFLADSAGKCKPCLPLLPNDFCINATLPLFTLFPGMTLCGSTMCATPSAPGSLPPLLPPCGASMAAPDAWYSFTPLCNGSVTIDTCGTTCFGTPAIDTELSVYTGLCNALTQVACNDDDTAGGCLPQSSVTFLATANTTYLIRVGDVLGLGGDFRIVANLVPVPPPNDQCTAATPISLVGGAATVCGTTFCATPTTGTGVLNPTPCGNSVNAPDVWYTFKPECSGPITIDTCGNCAGTITPFDTVLSVYGDSVGAGCGLLTQVLFGCDDNSSACSPQSEVSFNGIAGVTYYVRVAGNGIAAGDFQLNIAQTAITLPLNDLCANATVAGPGTLAWNNCGANTDGPPGPLPGGCSGVPQNDVWFSYTPACPGVVSLSTCQSGIDTVLAVYSGSCPSTGGSLAPIDCNDNATTGPCATTPQSYLTFIAAAGTTYTIRVGSAAFGVTGAGLLTINGPNPSVGTCPPAGSPFCRIYRVLGPSSGTPWAWSFTAPCCANFEDLNVLGVPVGPLGDANALALAFVNSINAVCPGTAMQIISPNFPGLFRVCLPLSCPGSQLAVGPAGTLQPNQCPVPVVSMISPLPVTGPCSFNPGIVALPITGMDADTNNIDDGTQIVLGISEDMNGNFIPDEIEDCVPPPTGLVLWLPFDEPSGPTAQNLAGDNDGILIGSPTYNSGSYVSNSLCFDGVDDYVAVTNYPDIGFGTNDFSVDAWVKVDPANSIRSIVEHRQVTPGPTVIGYSLLLWFDNTLAFQLGDGASWVNFNSSLAVPTDGQWHFVAVTVKRSCTTGISFYLDGLPPQQANPTPYPGSVTPPANVPLIVGASAFASSFFKGCIDEVELFNRELAPAEIAAIYNAGSAGKCKINPCPGWPVSIQIVKVGTDIVLSWPGPAQLQCANAVTGPWLNVPNASSPYTTPAANAMSFYRLKCYGFAGPPSSVVGYWSACGPNSPLSARWEHTAVWTGTEMILWGGFDGTTYFDDGARYNPVTGVWTPMPALNAPSARYRHTAVLDPVSGDMIVWGGLNGSTFLNDGARYKPNNTWAPIATPVGLAGRHYHTAVLAPTTGHMIVWGGRNTSSGLLNTGGRYDLVNDTWTFLPIPGAPSPRLYHEAVWASTTGRMIIWGGTDLVTTFGDGALYNPLNNTWATMNSAGGARSQFTSAWSGTEMLVWGGASGNVNLNTGARYNPALDSWTAMTTVNAPAARHLPMGAWTGGAFIVWGGGIGNNGFNTGGCYSPAANTWTPLPTAIAPPGRYFGRVVWTGNEMILTDGRNPANTLVTVFNDTWCYRKCP